MAKQKGTSQESNKVIWRYIVGGITFLGIVLALVNDSFDLIDRFAYESILQPVSQTQSKILVSDYFPLFVGSTKTYNVVGRTPTIGGGPIVLASSTYTEKVIMTVSGTDEDIHIYQVEQTGGEIYDMDCTGFGTKTSPSEIWYVSYHSSFFVACTAEEKGAIILELMNQKYSGTTTPDFTKISPILIFPLAVEDKWSAFPGMPINNDNPSYSWYVEEKLDYLVPAGKFSDCYRIVLYTASGTNIRFFCNGIGTVAMEYHHYGMPVDFRVELSSYSLSGNP